MSRYKAHMSKEINALSEKVLSHWFPMGKSFHVGVCRRTGTKGNAKGAGPNRMKMCPRNHGNEWKVSRLGLLTSG
jgi:hypothetical protein